MQQLAPDQIALVNELEPVAAGLLDKHVSSSKEWFPHELVPWSRGRDFEPGEAWDPTRSTSIPRCARACS
jgi:acyl-[acyl-carrier-protein] desaturase